MTPDLPSRRSAAGERLLATATRLFYAEGVHAVGIDRIIAEAGIAKATFYHHFKSKDDLVRAYVMAQSQQQRDAADPAASSPRDALVRAFEVMCEFGQDPAYRGCPFINAAAEYPDPAHAVRRAIDDHRAWCRDLFRELLEGMGDPEPARTAEVLVLLKDGLSVGFDLDAPETVHAAVRQAITRIIDAEPALRAV